MMNVVFDLGNTLKDENPRLVNLFIVKQGIKSLGYKNNVFMKYCEKISEYFKAFKNGDIHQITAFEVFFEILKDEKQAHKIVNYISNELSLNFKWKIDAKQSILALKNRNYRVYLLSNTIWNSRLYLANNQEFFSFFDKIYFSDEIGIRKPDISAFKKMINDGSTNSASDYWMVGDSYINDIEPAHSLGMRTIQMVNNDIALVKSGDHILKARTLTDAVRLILEEI